MARLPHDMAEKLMEIYQRNEKRYRLSNEAFKSIAGRTRVKGAFVKALQKLVPEIQKDDLAPGGARARHESLRISDRVA